MKAIKKFDVFLVLLILLVGGLVAMKFINLNQVGPGGDAVSYEKAHVEFVIRGVRQQSIDALHIGDTLYADATNNEVGKITSIDVEVMEKTLKKSDGTLVQAQVPDKFTVVVEVETQLNKKKIGYFAHGITEIKTNSEALIYTKYLKAISVVGGISFED